MILVGEELEYAISQYLDGTLSASEIAALEEVLATDADARELLRQHQQLHTALRSSPTIPAVDWDALLRETAHKCGAAPHADLTPKWSRSNTDLTRNYRLGGSVFRRFLPVALAASVLVAVGGVALIVSHSRTVSPATIAAVKGPEVEQSSGPVVAQVSIGAAPSVASNSYRNDEDSIDRPSIVLIDRADSPAAHDGDSLY